jgi:hypothetical protein
MSFRLSDLHTDTDVLALLSTLEGEGSGYPTRVEGAARQARFEPSPAAAADEERHSGDGGAF